MKKELDAELVKKKVEAVSFWWHSIDLGNGIITPGHKTPEIHARELKSFELPGLQGKDVLDVGAWDGFYSFECERRGASRIVALDHYVWSIKMPKLGAYMKDCRERGAVPELYDTLPGVWDPENLPGKAGFDVAQEVLNSSVEALVADFMEDDLKTIGQFDLVLFLGVLYHLQNPFLALQRLASVTRELAVIETAAIELRQHRDLAICEFYETDELAGEISNWWAPNEKALLGMCRAAGFKGAKTVSPSPARRWWRKLKFRNKLRRCRLVVHAWK